MWLSICCKGSHLCTRLCRWFRSHHRRGSGCGLRCHCAMLTAARMRCCCRNRCCDWLAHGTSIAAACPHDERTLRTSRRSKRYPGHQTALHLSASSCEQVSAAKVALWRASPLPSFPTLGSWLPGAESQKHTSELAALREMTPRFPHNVSVEAASRLGAVPAMRTSGRWVQPCGCCCA